jgi:hypothetical protein
MNLPILPCEGVNDLLLGSLLSADLETLVFTDSHPSKSPQKLIKIKCASSFIGLSHSYR